MYYCCHRYYCSFIVRTIRYFNLLIGFFPSNNLVRTIQTGEMKSKTNNRCINLIISNVQTKRQSYCIKSSSELLMCWLENHVKNRICFGGNSSKQICRKITSQISVPRENDFNSIDRLIHIVSSIDLHEQSIHSVKVNVHLHNVSTKWCVRVLLLFFCVCGIENVFVQVN